MSICLACTLIDENVDYIEPFDIVRVAECIVNSDLWKMREHHRRIIAEVNFDSHIGRSDIRFRRAGQASDRYNFSRSGLFAAGGQRNRIRPRV